MRKNSINKKNDECKIKENTITNVIYDHLTTHSDVNFSVIPINYNLF